MACDPQAIANATQELFLARLAALIQVKGATPPHSPGNLGSGWYTQIIREPDGSTHFGGERHALSTSADMLMVQKILTIGLHYNIRIVAT